MRIRFKQTPGDTNKGIPSGLGWFLIALGTFFLGAVLWKDTRLAVFGQLADGEITEITTRSSINTKSRNKGETRAAYHDRTRSGGKSHVLHVRYVPDGGAPVDIETLATWGFSEKVGDRVRMIYLPGEPHGAEIYSVKQVWLPIATGFTVSTLCLVGGGLIVRRRRAARATR